MRFDVKPIARTNGVAMDVELISIPADLGLDFPEHVFDTDVSVRFDGTIQNAGHGILVLTGVVLTAYDSVCARCLKPIHRDVRVDVREVFRPEHASQPEDHPELDEEDLEDAYTYKGFQIDATAVIRDNILAAIPMRELCREGCAGICPHCGTDLNETTCDCVKNAAAQPDQNPKGQDNERSSPFEKLKELL